MNITLLEWLIERRGNCLLIAKGKSGLDREGWLQDASYFSMAILCAQRCVTSAVDAYRKSNVQLTTEFQQYSVNDKDRVRGAHAAVASALGKLADEVFTDDCKLTFVMRVPNFPNRFMVVSDDDLDEVIAAISRSKERAEVSLVESK